MQRSSAPELLAPAGSLQSALCAFNAGADAVYFGLSQFSARAAAINFSHEDARRLKTSALQQNRRIYAAVNTLVNDSEIPELLRTAAFLNYLEVDAVIVQDWGAAFLLQSEFPQLELHASTQMALHDSAGLQWAKRLGIKRTVVPREISSNELHSLMQELPDTMQIEAFIHGAQCFGFSGLCLASGIQLGRSANRGACAQVCRTWFTAQSGSRLYPFSANDKAMGSLVSELVQAGVHSLKIEGRMKSPRYVQDTTAWYRSIIDEEISKPADAETSAQALRSIFARDWTPGFWKNPKGNDMLNQAYPGATGRDIGKVIRIASDHFILSLKAETAPPQPRDGVLLVSEGEWIQAGIRDIAPLYGTGNTSKHMFSIQAQRESQRVIPDPGSHVRLISRHDSLLPEIKPASIAMWQKKTGIQIEVEKTGIHISCPWYKNGFTTAVEAARQADGLEKQLHKIFTFRGEYFNFHCKSIHGSQNHFIPSSQLKALRRTWANAAEKEYWAQRSIQIPTPEHTAALPQIIPSRKDLQVDGLPFHIPGSPIQAWIDLSARLGLDCIWIPIFPISLGDKIDLHEIADLAGDQNLILGINNPGTAERCVELAQSRPDIRFFGDYGLYAANVYASSLYHEKITGFLFNSPWLESPSDIKTAAQHCPMDFKNFKPPLFISRICLRRTKQQNSCHGCPYTMQKPIEPDSWSLVFEQNQKNYRVYCRNCWTFVFPE